MPDIETATLSPQKLEMLKDLSAAGLKLSDGCDLLREYTGLPFKPGQSVEVVMIAEDEGKMHRLMSLKALFKETQTLPQAKSISEDQIIEEVMAYRAAQ